jgi:hypothetical protein
MTHRRYHSPALLLLAIAGCSSPPVESRDLLVVTNGPPADGEGALEIGGSVPAWAGKLRVKLNGQYLGAAVGTDVTELEIWGGFHAMVSATLAPGAREIELVDRAGQTLLHTGPVDVRPGARTFVWVHDSSAGLVAEVPNLTPDADPSTVEVRVLNVSSDEHVIVSRCVGHKNCPKCVTSPVGGQSEFPPQDCTTITTVGPAETWFSLQPIDGAAPAEGYDSSCVATHLEGQPLAPGCSAELDPESQSFQELTDLFVDGLTPGIVSNPDGSTKGMGVGAFDLGNRF